MIIGIGGCSNSGKSMLAMGLAGYFGRLRSVVLNMDDFVYPKEQLPLIRDHINWEVPETIDIKRYISRVKQEAATKSFVFCEGIFAFHFKELNDLYDYRIFLELSSAEFYRRKQHDLRWGREPDWYIRHIRAGYEKYKVLPSGRDILLLDADKPIDIQLLAQKIKQVADK